MQLVWRLPHSGSPVVYLFGHVCLRDCTRKVLRNVMDARGVAFEQLALRSRGVAFKNKYIVSAYSSYVALRVPLGLDSKVVFYNVFRRYCPAMWIESLSKPTTAMVYSQLRPALALERITHLMRDCSFVLTLGFYQAHALESRELRPNVVEATMCCDLTA